ncbi:uncharacterized protein MELLADRAFT_67237 [Melampsora larici-populina 98AG31]|uniref:Uncharacterized protein n=1 Tax=Melampsora larici-populina (strain 98AG31 / pathotype 3-4-7) TaxID=747676 RepID=F4S2B1_MELLP|nr:uncharacterized protein MELLADRAFT_67237 [Melampsora larici-populina 98AG31]EGG01235.1 hypothetical protein MELLADRAFT_67237 [Melampsora larici-populina 98AG31]
MDLQYLPMGFQSELVIAERVRFNESHLSKAPTDLLLLQVLSHGNAIASMGQYSTELFITIDGPQMAPANVIESTPGQLQTRSTYYTYGRIILPPYHSVPILHSDRAVLAVPAVDSPTSSTYPNHVLITSIGRVLDCYYSDIARCWVLIVLHRDWESSSFSTVSFRVRYTIRNDTMGTLGLEMFQLDALVSLSGTLSGYAQSSQEWTVNLPQDL